MLPGKHLFTLYDSDEEVCTGAYILGDGEDISFCVKLFEAKIDIWSYPNVLVNHMKIQKMIWYV